ALADRHHQLNLVVIVAGLGRVGDGGAGKRDRVGWLLEEDRRVAVSLAAHLFHMRDIVAADAIEAPDRKALVAAGDWNGRDLWRLDNVGLTHRAYSSCDAVCSPEPKAQRIMYDPSIIHYYLKTKL